ncbi:MAG TPA: CapA family protein [bacterium]
MGLAAVALLLAVLAFSPPTRSKLNSIFAESRGTDRPAVPDSVHAVLSIAVVGDVMMEGSALSVIRREGPDYPFAAVRFLLDSADVAIANLEAPFGEGGHTFPKTFTFRVPPAFAPGLRSAGFDVLTLANNHILDYGPDLLFSTLTLLDTLKLSRCGAGRHSAEAELPAIVRRAGWTVAVFAYSMTYPEQFWATPKRCGTAFPKRDSLQKRIAAVRDSVDLVVVCFHWGQELSNRPHPYQREFARLSIDAGADFVVGHHPHVLQGFELYKGKPIAYSLGNFVFGSNSESCRESAIVKAFFTRDGFHHAEVFPISVHNRIVRYQPRILEGEGRKRTIGFLNAISRPLNSGRNLLSESGVLMPEEGAHDGSALHAQADSARTGNQ